MIESDKALRRAVDRASGLAVTYLGTGIPQEMTAFFRLERAGQVLDFEASYNSGEGGALRASKGLPPSERLQLLRGTKEFNCTVDVGRLGLSSREEVGTFVEVMKACISTFVTDKKVAVILGQSLA